MILLHQLQGKLAFRKRGLSIGHNLRLLIVTLLLVVVVAVGLGEQVRNALENSPLSVLLDQVRNEGTECLIQPNTVNNLVLLDQCEKEREGLVKLGD